MNASQHLISSAIKAIENNICYADWSSEQSTITNELESNIPSDKVWDMALQVVYSIFPIKIDKVLEENDITWQNKLIELNNE